MLDYKKSSLKYKFHMFESIVHPIFFNRNLSKLKIHWTIDALETLPPEFAIIPTIGKIKAKAVYKIEVFFRARQEQVYNFNIKFHVMSLMSFSNG